MEQNRQKNTWYARSPHGGIRPFFEGMKKLFLQPIEENLGALKASLGNGGYKLKFC